MADSIEQLVITARFVGANPNPRASGDNPLDYICNYFLGNVTPSSVIRKECPMHLGGEAEVLQGRGLTRDLQTH